MDTKVCELESEPLFVKLLAVYGGNSADSHEPFNVIMNLVFLTCFPITGYLYKSFKAFQELHVTQRQPTRQSNKRY